MAITTVAFDTSAPPGQKLDPEVRAEVAAVAPGNLDDGEVTEAKLHDNSVSKAKLKLGAVDSTIIANGGVDTDNIAAGAVDTGKIADGSVAGAKAGMGVAKAKDPAGNYVALTFVKITAAAYAALTTPDPNTAYLIS